MRRREETSLTLILPNNGLLDLRGKPRQNSILTSKGRMTQQSPLKRVAFIRWRVRQWKRYRPDNSIAAME
jgi:hypothetical protein